MPGAYAHTAALRSDIDRLIDLVGAADTLDPVVPGLDWTASQTLTHVIVAVSGISMGIRGDVSGLRFVTDSAAELGDATPTEAVAAVNAKSLSFLHVTDPKEAAEGLRNSGETLLAAIAEAEPGFICPTPWYGAGNERPAWVMSAVAHGEFLVHGLDVARALGRPWELPEETVGEVAYAVWVGMMPFMLTAEGRAFEGAVNLEIRGGKAFSLAFGGGKVTVGEPLPEGAAGCRLSLTPGAALLVAYGRADHKPYFDNGEITASGLDPELAVRVPGFFDKP